MVLEAARACRPHPQRRDNLVVAARRLEAPGIPFARSEAVLERLTASVPAAVRGSAMA